MKRQKRKVCVLYSEKPWWVNGLDEEMKRRLTLKDRPKQQKNENAETREKEQENGKRN